MNSIKLYRNDIPKHLSMERLGANRTLIRGAGADFLISYRTPVVCLLDGILYVNYRNYSVTTTKHVNKTIRELWFSVPILPISPAHISDLWYKALYNHILSSRDVDNG
jgi:hypothetical protein